MRVLTVLIDLQYLAFTFGHIFYLTIVRLKILISICLSVFIAQPHKLNANAQTNKTPNTQHVVGRDIKHERDSFSCNDLSWYWNTRRVFYYIEWPSFKCMGESSCTEMFSNGSLIFRGFDRDPIKKKRNAYSTEGWYSGKVCKDFKNIFQ